MWSRYGDKRHLVFVLAGVLVFGGLTALGINAFVSGDFDSGTEQVIGGIITGFLTLGLVFCGYAAVTFPARRHRLPGVAVDAAGVWWYRERAATLVPWPDIAGVGVGYLRAPAAAVAGGSSLGRRRNFAFEVFLRVPGLPARSVLRTWAATEPPPVPSLPADRLRFVVITGGDRHDLQAAVQRHAPRLWVGEYEREWTRLGAFGK
ncbi:hypothetical protein AOZ06_30165 [Kibdelosporangium phytohabitans]|uniref:Uncharacterized protein n=1 Tax=Kibdelosporangium phytohabitans TaxID=860235 RepID=A0A0N9I7V3_9PSEU|nr:hypothetical protein AOZ06_30165 [Kibdelosporangium phytohabitans]